MRKTAQTFLRCSALASARARRGALHRGGGDDAVVASACLRMLLTGTSRTRDRTRRSLLPRRPLPRACTPRPTRRTARARAKPNTPDPTNATPLTATQPAPPRSAYASPAAPDCDAHHRHCQKTGAWFAALRCRCNDVAFLHAAIISCASLRAVQPHPPPGLPHSRLRRIRSPPSRPPGVAERRAKRPIGKSRGSSKTHCAPLYSCCRFLCAAQTKTGRTRRPVGLSRRGVRLSGRLPRAARRSRPASAGRSTAPDLRSPARRSSLRRTRPR